jgi:hypothetical protein
MTTLGHAQIIEAADAGLARLLAVTDAHPAAFLGDAYLRRTTTDVLSHLHAWHTLFEGWIEADRAGQPVAYPAEGYSWRDLDALNESLYSFHAGRDYDSVRVALVASHDRVCAIVAATPEAELTGTDSTEWLGDESLGDVAQQCLGSHYEWALGILEAAGFGDDS